MSSLFVGSDAIEEAFRWKDAIDALRQQYGREISDDMFPPRIMARGKGTWLRTLSGVAPNGGLMGAKLIAANTGRGRVSYLVALFDQQSAELVALVDGNLVTGYRTAATTALAVDLLTTPGAIDVGVLGTGFEARHHVQALAAVRDLSSVTAFSPSPASREAFIEYFAPLGVPVRQAESAAALLDTGPDVLVCAARSRDEQPLFSGSLLRSGTTVASIGSTLPEQREVDSRTIDRASIIVADMPAEVSEDTGDMLAARADGVPFESKLVSLADVVSGKHPGREDAEDIVLYKSVGAALQDITVAAMCVERARSLGLATELPRTVEALQK